MRRTFDKHKNITLKLEVMVKNTIHFNYGGDPKKSSMITSGY
jgi:hypothetical protein